MKGKESISVTSTEEGKVSIKLANADVEYTLEALNIDPTDLHYGRGTDRYTPQQKVQAVMYYLALGGNAGKVERKTGIPSNTIRKWKSCAPWWQEVVRKARAIKQDELDAMFTLVIHDVVDSIVDRVEAGDWKINPKTGLQERIPVSAKDLVVIQSMMFDKRSLLRGDPTNIQRKAVGSDQLKAIEAKLLSTIQSAKQEKVVSEQTPTVEDYDE